MTRCIGINLRSLTISCYAWSCLLIFFCKADGITQGSADSFLEQYQAIIGSEENTDVAIVDSAVHRLVSINKKQPGKYDSLITPLLIWHYNWKSRKLSVEERLLLLHAHRAIIQNLRTSYPADVARFYGLYLSVFWSRYQTDSLAHYLDLIEDVINKSRVPLEVKTQWLYEKGRYAVNQGDYEAALTFYQRGLEYLNKHFPDQLRIKFLLQNAIGIGYRRTGNASEAIQHYENILARFEEQVHSVKMTGAFLNNLGLAYKDRNDCVNSIRRIKEAINYYSKNFSPDYPDIGSAYDNIAICYENQGKLDSALFFSHKSLEFIRQNLGTGHPDLLLPMNGITSVLLKKGKYAEALAINTKAKALMIDLGWRHDDPDGNYYMADGFDVFASSVKIRQALFARTADTTHLIRAIEDGDYFMSLTDYAYDNLKNDLSKEIFQLKHASMFSACVANLHTLYKITYDPSIIEKAFEYAEKFKSLELLYAAQKDKADQNPSYKWLNDEYEVQIDSILHYERLAEARKTDKVAFQQVVSRLNAFKEALYLWKERTKQNHPDYFKLIYRPDPVTFTELKKALRGDDQCILSYHLAEDAIYAFVITEDQSHFIKKEINIDLPELISDFRHAINGYFTDTIPSETSYVMFANQFAKSGAALYNLLIEPVRKFLDHRVVIIVDKALGYLPFDLLAKEAPKEVYHFKQYPYLLLDHAISYSYSARLWMDMRLAEKNSSGVRMLAFAPSFPGAKSNIQESAEMRTGFGRLLFNEREVKNINKIIPGKLMLGTKATKDAFTRYSPQYAIIHLATHSKANDEQGEYSFLAFTDAGDSDSRLLASEIYNLDLHAELVTLSACETGLGELKSGEGIISLARAFSFAGAKSIVSSLWPVNDKSTPSLMASFYSNMKNGLHKDIAMQKARIDFIASGDHADAHPFFWGSFICVGDMEAISMTGNSFPSCFLILLIVVTIVFLFFLKNKFNSQGTTPE